MVLPGLSEDLIIGTATMQKWRFKLDFEHEELRIKREGEEWLGRCRSGK